MGEESVTSKESAASSPSPAMAPFQLGGGCGASYE